MFYGNQNAENYKIGKRLDEESYSELINLAYSKIPSAKKDPNIVYKTTLQVGLDDRLITASGDEATLRQLPRSTSIYCPVHVDHHPSAFVTQSRQGIKGVHCVTCNATFWSEPLKEYSFDALGTLMAECEKLKDDYRPTDNEWMFGIEEPIRISRIKERYLPPIHYSEGITLIKSPKGSGKTEALKRLVDAFKMARREKKVKNDLPKSVLLIGHRQNLLREACHKLGLTCYLDSEPTNFYGVCLDSIGIKLNRKDGFPPYDLVIIDESEQVFSHLTSETIAKQQNGLSITFQHLSYYIKAAKAVIALDADLGTITMASLQELKNRDWKRRFNIVYNEGLNEDGIREIQIFKSKGQLVEDLIENIKAGKRCFVTSNSRGKIDELEAIIKKEKGIRHIKVTSDNSAEEHIIEFVKNIKEKAKEVDAILASPSLGTGVDITFPNNEIVYENVYGFFEPFINTHTDIDQQLARVRHPKDIKVYITPRGYAVETDVNVILESLGRGYINPAAVSIADDGALVVERNDPLLKIYAQVISYQNASKSKLAENFIKLKQGQGWKIINVEKNVRKADEGNKKLGEGKAERVKEAVREYLSAPEIDDEEFFHLYACQMARKRLKRIDKIKLEKALVEKSLSIKLDKTLAGRAVQGSFLEKLGRFHHISNIRDNSFIGGLTEELIASETFKKRYLSKVSINILLNIVLRICGFAEGDRFDLTKQVSQNDLSLFISFCEENGVMIGKVLGRPIRKDVRERALMTLNPILAKMGLRLEPIKAKKKQGKVTLLYGFNPTLLKQYQQYISQYKAMDEACVLEIAGYVREEKLDKKGFISKYININTP